MNIQLKDITVTARDGRVSHLDQVYIRGSHVRFFIVPDMLRYVISPRRQVGNGSRTGRFTWQGRLLHAPYPPIGIASYGSVCWTQHVTSRV